MVTVHEEIAALQEQLRSLNQQAAEAAKAGDFVAVPSLIDKYADNYKEIALYAQIYGHNDIFALRLIDQGVDNVNEIALYAAIYRHKDIVALAIEKGADNFNEIEFTASGHGHKGFLTEVYQYAKETGNTVVISALEKYDPQLPAKAAAMLASKSSESPTPAAALENPVTEVKKA